MRAAIEVVQAGRNHRNWQITVQSLCVFWLQLMVYMSSVETNCAIFLAPMEAIHGGNWLRCSLILKVMLSFLM